MLDGVKDSFAERRPCPVWRVDGRGFKLGQVLDLLPSRGL